jgi:hypothetical protein
MAQEDSVEVAQLQRGWAGAAMSWRDASAARALRCIETGRPRMALLAKIEADGDNALMSVSAFLNRQLSRAAAALGVVAVAAAWPIAAQATRGDAIWMAPLVAAAAALAVRFMEWPGAWQRMLTTVLLIAIATVHARWMQVAALHAGMLGLPWEDALRSLDPGFVWAVVRARTEPVDWLIQGAALAGAIAVSVWPTATHAKRET